MPVEVCYTETRRVCDNRKRNLDGFEEYSAVNETCLSVFETGGESDFFKSRNFSFWIILLNFCSKSNPDKVVTKNYCNIIWLLLVCETYKTTRVVSDDYADCEVQSLELCERSGKCPKIPKTKCEIVTKNVTKEIPESKVSTFKPNTFQKQSRIE